MATPNRDTFRSPPRSESDMREVGPGGTTIRRSDLQVLMQDLATAAEFQKATLPQTPPEVPGYDIAYFFRPARELSGDFYDFLALEGGRLGIAIADASGKGISACLLATVCRALLRAYTDPSAPPKHVLAAMNRRILACTKRGMFLSAIFASLDPATHTLVAANAGHLPVVVWHSREKVATGHPSRSPVLGVVAPAEYEVMAHEDIIMLEPGDRFVLMTDGVNEAMAPGQKEFGMEHLRRRLISESDRPSADFLRSVIDQIDIHRGGGEQSDDITLVTVRRLP